MHILGKELDQYCLTVYCATALSPHYCNAAMAPLQLMILTVKMLELGVNPVSINLVLIKSPFVLMYLITQQTLVWMEM